MDTTGPRLRALRLLRVLGPALLPLLAGCGGGKAAPPKEPLALKAPASVAPGGEARLEAKGGTPPYTFSLGTSSESGGSVDASGRYRAGETEGQDVAVVEDSVGASATRKIRVELSLRILPAKSRVAPGGTIAFHAEGGTPSYAFFFSEGKNRSGGSLDSGTGRYRAGPTPGTDVVVVRDSGGARVETTVAVEPEALSMRPAEARVRLGESLAFAPQGGVPPYKFSLVSAESGARMEENGSYLAGRRPGTDRVRVTDGRGKTADGTVVVEPLVLSIRPGDRGANAGEAIDFAADGGRPPVRLALAENATGATLDPASGRYVAGRRSGRDRVRATDSAGAVAEAMVTVSLPALSLDPAEASLSAGESVRVRAGGGVPPLKFAVEGLAGGSLVEDPDGLSALYRAPAAGLPVGGAVATVRVTDSAEPPQSSEARITVRGAAPATAGPGPRGGGGEGAPAALSRKRRKGPVALLPRRTVLPNGCVVIVEENHTRPVVSVVVSIRGGTTVEPKGCTGLTILWADLLAQGSEKLKPLQIVEEVRAFGGNYGVNLRDDITWCDRTQVEIECRPAHVGRALELLAEAVLRPRPTTEGLQRVREARIAARKRIEADPVGRGADALFVRVFGDHPYARAWRGTPEGLAACGLAEVHSHARLLGTPGRLTVVVSGDVDGAEVGKLAAKLLGAAPAAPAPAAPPPLPASSSGARAETIAMPAPQATLMVGWLVPGYAHADRIAIETLPRILRDKLWLRLVVVDKVASYTRCDHDLLSDLGVLWALATVPNPSDVPRAEKAILECVAELRGKPVPEDVLKREKTGQRLDFIRRREYARERALEIARGEAAGGIRYALGYLGRLQNLTGTEISRAAAQYLREANLSVIRVVPEGTAAPGPGEEAGVERARAALKDEKPIEKPYAIRLYGADAAATVIDDRGTLAEAGAEAAGETLAVTLRNGLRALIVEDRAVPLASVGIVTGAGTAHDPTGAGGLAQILWSLPWKGTVKRDGTAIHNHVQSLGIGWYLNLTPDYAAIVASGLADDGDEVAALVGDILSAPRLFGSDFEDLKRSRLSAEKSAAQDPVSAATDLARSALFPDHPYGWPALGHPDWLGRTEVQHVWELAHRCLRPDRALVLFVGDLPPEKARALLERTVGGWVSPPAVVEPRPPGAVGEPAAARAGRYRVSVPPGAVAVVRGARAPAYGSPDYAAAVALRWLLHFRLRREAVEERPIATDASVDYDAWRRGGALRATAVTAPERLEEAREVLVRLLAKVRDEPPPPEELRRAQDWIAAQQVRDEQVGGAIALRLARDDRLAGDPDYEERFFYELERVTPARVQDLARRLLAEDKVVETVASP
ncbi:MAG: insulinase family protein [Planctomycetales bacterium]|nr:insulinase family protein [Planctomycetales bacterium]